MATPAEIREAMLALRNAGLDEKNAAKARVTTLCGQTALTIADKTERQQFIATHHQDIENAMRA